VTMFNQSETATEVGASVDVVCADWFCRRHFLTTENTWKLGDIFVDSARAEVRTSSGNGTAGVSESHNSTLTRRFDFVYQSYIVHCHAVRIVETRLNARYETKSGRASVV
jgi:hypothetical protein